MSESGWLWKLGGGKTDWSQSKWYRRYFAQHGNLLLYYHQPPAVRGALAPNGLVLLDGCDISARSLTAAGDGALRFEFGLSHRNGECLVLAAESEADRKRWLDTLAGCRAGAGGAGQERTAEREAPDPAEAPAVDYALEAARLSDERERELAAKYRSSPAYRGRCGPLPRPTSKAGKWTTCWSI